MKILVLILTLFSFSSLAETSSEKLGFECAEESFVSVIENYNYGRGEGYELYLSFLRNCPTESLIDTWITREGIKVSEVWHSYGFVSAALKALDIKLMQKLLDAGFDINQDINDYFGYRKYGTVLFHAEEKLEFTKIGSFWKYILSDEDIERRLKKIKKIEPFVKFLKENGGRLDSRCIIFDFEVPCWA